MSKENNSELESLTEETVIALAAMMNPRDRNNLMTALGQQGKDKRRGVSLDKNGVPDVLFLDVDNQAFQISKYLVTYEQFQAFIKDGGYEEGKPWWKLLNNDGVPSPRWKFNNRPVDSVSWHDALAYCFWLSLKLGYVVCLPTTDEWEAAARGGDDRIYPWGNEYLPGYANCDESNYDGPIKAPLTYLEETSAVGAYPQGQSPCGAMDMAGNTWEYTMSREQQDEFIEAVQKEIDKRANEK